MAAQIGHTGAQGDRTVKVKNPVRFPLGTSLWQNRGLDPSPYSCTLYLRAPIASQCLAVCIAESLCIMHDVH